MNKIIAATLFLASLTQIAHLAAGQDTADMEFKSSAAKKSVSDFRDKLERLNKKLDEQIELARVKLKTDLEAALKAAVDKRDFAEVQRISSFLKAAKVPVQVAPRVKELEAQIDRLKQRASRSGSNRKHAFRPELLVGSWSVRWNNQEPSLLAFSPDGKITTQDDKGRTRTNGEWKYDEPRRRVLIRWVTTGNWDSLHFPFDNNTTTGDSHAGPNVIRASKVR